MFPEPQTVFKDETLNVFLANFVNKYLIETSLIESENNWEKRDSALEILEICYEYLNISNTPLKNKIFR